MGLDQKVTFGPAEPPSWPRVLELLSSRGMVLQLRMIDGQLALPDEQPAPDWQELRCSTTDGMVTLRRETDGIRLVIWGNADVCMRQAWNAIACAIAVLSAGTITTTNGTVSAKEFAQAAELPPGFATGNE
jgi:hypothetical protein